MPTPSVSTERPLWRASTRFVVLAAAGLYGACHAAAGAPLEHFPSRATWAAVDEAETGELKARFESQWQHQEQLPLNAHLTIKHLHCLPQGLAKEKWLSLLASAGPLTNDSALTTIGNALLPKNTEVPFGNVEFWDYGKRYREDMRSGTFEARQASDGQKSLRYNAKAKQVDVIDDPAQGNLPQPLRLAKLRYFPKTNIPREVEVMKRDNGHVLLVYRAADSGAYSEFVLDEQSGMPLLQTSYARDPSNGTSQVVLQRWQQDWTESPEGISYPQVYVEAKYQGDLLSYVHLAVVTGAEFNREVPDELFTKLAVPAATTIVDHSDGSPKRHRLSHASSNVLAEVATLPHRVDSVATDSGSGFAIALLAANAVLVLFLLLFLVPRVRARA